MGFYIFRRVSSSSGDDSTGAGVLNGFTMLLAIVALVIACFKCCHLCGSRRRARNIILARSPDDVTNPTAHQNLTMPLRTRDEIPSYPGQVLTITRNNVPTRVIALPWREDVVTIRPGHETAPSPRAQQPPTYPASTQQPPPYPAARQQPPPYSASTQQPPPYSTASQPPLYSASTLQPLPYPAARQQPPSYLNAMQQPPPYSTSTLQPLPYPAARQQQPPS